MAASFFAQCQKCSLVQCCFFQKGAAEFMPRILHPFSFTVKACRVSLSQTKIVLFVDAKNV